MLKKKRGYMETERLLLRPWEQKDYADFMEFSCDPEVMLPSGSKPVETQEEGEREFSRICRNKDAYAIVLKDAGKAIGNIKFQRDIRRYKVHSLSIGYEIGKPYWGRGYMPEALFAMIAYGFEELKLEVLAIAHFSVNQRSRRVIEKCGFHYEGMLPKAFRRFDGALFDDESYSIVREDYFARKGRE